MKTLVLLLTVIIFFGCGEVEKEKSTLTKEGVDIIPGTGLPLVSLEQKVKIKKVTTEVSHFEHSLNSSDTINIVLPSDTAMNSVVLSDNGKIFNTSIKNSVETNQCLVTVTPSPELPSFDDELPTYELRMTDSSALKECPVYYTRFVSTVEEPSRDLFVKKISVDLDIDSEQLLFQSVDITALSYSGNSILVEPPQNSSLQYKLDLQTNYRGKFVSKNEGEIKFSNNSTYALLRSNSNDNNFLSSKKTYTVSLEFKALEGVVKVVGYNELTLTDSNGETKVEDKFYMNGQEISKEDFLEVFSFGPTPWKF